MKIALYVVGGIVLLVILFIIKQTISCIRGGGKRDELLFKELEDLSLLFDEKIEGEELQQLVNEKAERPELRPMLYLSLSLQSKTDYFPEKYLTHDEVAKSELAYWLGHPHELNAFPDNIEVLDSIEFEKEGKKLTYYAMRFRKLGDHWATNDGWMLGTAGPYEETHKPGYPRAGGFSRFMEESQTTPQDEINWYYERYSHLSADLIPETPPGNEGAAG